MKYFSDLENCGFEIYSKNINRDIGVENVHYLNDSLWKSTIEI